MSDEQGELRFDGSDYDHEEDHVRLTGQIGRIVSVMRDGGRRTLDEISKLAHAPAASVSAQLRHLRKERFGSHKVHKENLGNGIWVYWIDFNGKVPVVE